MSMSPSLLDAQAATVGRNLNALWAWLVCHAVGGIVSDGGTTQGTGTNGTLNFDVDTTAITDSLIDGKVHVLGAQTDADATAGSTVLWGATSGKSVVFAVVFSTGTGNDTPAVKGIPGTVATTGSQVAPTDAEIDTSLGHDNWCRLCDMTINRTGDTTVTFTFNNAARYAAAVQGGHREQLAESEAAFSSTSPTIP